MLVFNNKLRLVKMAIFGAVENNFAVGIDNSESDIGRSVGP